MHDTADLRLRWHLVGHLQSNKARKAGATFDVIHSVDDVGLIAKLDEAAEAVGHHLELLVQVDLAGEATKHGVPPEGLIAMLSAARGRRSTRLTGLMLLPPAMAEPELARPYFARLRNLRDDLAAPGMEQSMLRELSMGMSQDFEVAIEEGATFVRVGSAIFGDRTDV